LRTERTFRGSSRIRSGTELGFAAEVAQQRHQQVGVIPMRNTDAISHVPRDASDSGEQLGVLRALLTGGEILPSQLPSASHWGPELCLAAAVFVQAMSDIRLRRADGRDHVLVSSATRWVQSNDVSWPLSFVRVCELLQLDPSWVRRSVRRWLHREAPVRARAYRRAA